MPILRRSSQSSSTDQPPGGSATDQPAGSGAVPVQRDTQEGTSYPVEYSQGESRGATGTRYQATRADSGQAERRRAGAHAYDESTDSRSDTRRRYYGMAGTLMVLSGLLTFFIGIVGVIKGVFYNTVATYPFYYSVRSRGVTLIVIGAVAFVVGIALLIHVAWARHVATVVAMVTAIANFVFLPFYPFWSVILIALNVLIIWELTRDRPRREFVRLDQADNPPHKAVQGRPRQLVPPRCPARPPGCRACLQPPEPLTEHLQHRFMISKIIYIYRYVFFT
jgi:hypothetical protein